MDRRLAFRELGLSIGLAAVERLTAGNLVSADRLEPLRRHLPLRERIEDFWLEPENRQAPTWREHRDINEVMLATTLAPEGYLAL